MRSLFGRAQLPVSLALLGLGSIEAALTSAPLAAQQTAGQRTAGHTAMGGPMLQLPRREPPPWPSAARQIAPIEPYNGHGWQHRIKRQPVSTDRAAGRQRRIVAFDYGYPIGSLVIANRERALYHVQAQGRAVRYPVAIGTATEVWTGVEFVTDKKVNPAWYPVHEVGKEIKEPVAGGDPANPLGVRALYLGRTLWRIHGTPAVETIGQNVSNGCIRMLNEHVVELFDQVMLGTEVYVVDRLGDMLPAHRGRKTILTISDER